MVTHKNPALPNLDRLTHLAEREGVLSLTLGFNGEPLNTALLDNFAYEVHARFARKQKQVVDAK